MIPNLGNATNPFPQFGPVANQHEFAVALQEVCQNCEKALSVKARDSQAYAAWGSALLQLAHLSSDYDQKQEYLKASRDKLSRAVDINPKATSPDKLPAILELGNTFFMTYLVEEDDSVASKFMEKAESAYKKGVKLNAATAQALLAQLPTAAERRKEAQSTLQRFRGKTGRAHEAELAAFLEEAADAAARKAEWEGRD